MALFDSDNKILITRRSQYCGIFKRAWVLPGGHVEIGESLEYAVARETTEETGVEIKMEKDKNGNEVFYHNNKAITLEPFYAFESSSMKQAEFDRTNMSPPSSGHLILFFRISLNDKCSDIQLKVDPGEVDGAAWLDKE